MSTGQPQSWMWAATARCICLAAMSQAIDTRLKPAADLLLESSQKQAGSSFRILCRSLCTLHFACSVKPERTSCQWSQHHHCLMSASTPSGSFDLRYVCLALGLTSALVS